MILPSSDLENRLCQFGCRFTCTTAAELDVPPTRRGEHVICYVGLDTSVVNPLRVFGIEEEGIIDPMISPHDAMLKVQDSLGEVSSGLATFRNSNLCYMNCWKYTIIEVVGDGVKPVPTLLAQLDGTVPAADHDTRDVEQKSQGHHYLVSEDCMRNFCTEWALGILVWHRRWDVPEGRTCLALSVA